MNVEKPIYNIGGRIAKTGDNAARQKKAKHTTKMVYNNARCNTMIGDKARFVANRNLTE